MRFELVRLMWPACCDARDDGLDMPGGKGDGPRWNCGMAPLGMGGDAPGVPCLTCWKPGWFCICGCCIMACSGGAGVPRSSPSSPPSSSSSSSPPPVLSAKSAGPLCSCAPPYCVSCQCSSFIPFTPQLTPPHTYWNLPTISLMSDDEYSYNFLLWPKMTTATSTEQRTESSCAFLNKPPLRLRKVTDRLRSSRTATQRLGVGWEGEGGGRGGRQHTRLDLCEMWSAYRHHQSHLSSSTLCDRVTRAAAVVIISGSIPRSSSSP